jgi:acyl carrier protein
MEEKIKKIMSDVFLIDISTINNSSSQDTIENWDSIGHLNLITSLEETYKIIFDEEEIIQMLNFELVCLITIEKINSLKS